MAPDDSGAAEVLRRAGAADAADSLSGYRDRFVPLPDGVIYLDGNSLGRPLRHLPALLARVIEEEWGGGLIGSWDHWELLAGQVGDELGAALLGARPGEVTVSDSTTVNLYKLAMAAIAARPGRDVLLIDSDSFPTDRYVLDGIAERHGLQVREVPSHLDEGFDLEAVRASLDERVALVCLSHVGYRSAAMADMAPINQAIHSIGALALWDLCHSVGAVPIDLTASGCDLAVGCTYKYLNAGPGAPAFLYVRREHHSRLRSPIWGWFGAADQFEMGGAYAPRPDIGRFQAGTPPILGVVSVREGVRVLAEAGGPSALYPKGVALTDFGIELADRWLAPVGFRVASPRRSDRRGSHLTLEHRSARHLCALLTRAGVLTDFRTPDRIRLGMAALTTTFTDVARATLRLAELAAA